MRLRHSWQYQIIPVLLFVTAVLDQSSMITRARIPSSAAENWYLPLAIFSSPELLHPPSPSNVPIRRARGTPIDITPDGETVWVVNPDSGTVSAIITADLEKMAEVPAGDEPWSVAIDNQGESIYVVDRAGHKVFVIDGSTYEQRDILHLDAQPGTIILSPSNATAYLTLPHLNQVVVIETATLQIVSRISTASHPFGLALTNDGDQDDNDERLFVTHYFAQPHANGIEATDDGRIGLISLIDTQSHTVETELTLGANEQGFPNLLASIALGERYGWIPHTRAAPDLPTGLTTSVFAAVSVLDVENGKTAPELDLPLNDQIIFGSPVNNPEVSVPSPDDKTLYVLSAGSNVVEVVNMATPAEPRLVKFLPTGTNPRGMVLSPDGQRGYVMNYLSRSVSVLDLLKLEPGAEIDVTEEVLSADVLRGKILFNTATNPKLTTGSWISCASCHPDGGTDTVTWMFPDGPRQTPPLWNAYETLPWHWSAALDEFQDVEETIHLIQRGSGLAPGEDPPLLGSPNAGRSDDLDALADFLEQGIRIPRPPQGDADLANGRALFESAGCADCHGGPAWTSSNLPGAAGSLDPDGNCMVDDALRDVGTLNERDVRGATGFDPPSLLDVGLTSPYLHDGSMPDLASLLASGHPNPQNEETALEDEEVEMLLRFVQSIGPDTEPVAGE